VSAEYSSTCGKKKLEEPGEETRSCSFPMDSCKFPTEEIMGAKNSILPPNSQKMGYIYFQPQTAFLDQNFRRRKFSERLRFAER